MKISNLNCNADFFNNDLKIINVKTGDYISLLIGSIKAKIYSGTVESITNNYISLNEVESSVVLSIPIKNIIQIRKEELL